MGKKRDLNGLPNVLEQQFFSTLFYWKKGYMADWIWNAANELEINDIEIDILRGTTQPSELQIEPITANLERLRTTIQNTLTGTKFELDYITEAKFEIYISQRHKASKLFTCKCTTQDKLGNTYEGKLYTEQAYEDNFEVFRSNSLTKIRRTFNA